MVRLVLPLVVAALSLGVTGGGPGALPVTGAPPGVVPGMFPEAHVAQVASSSPSLVAFSQSLPKGDSATVVGVYVEEKLALRVLEQPAGQPGFVTSQEDAVSHFSLAQTYGTVGLIAHDTLAGQAFFGLQEGDRIVLVSGDGTLKPYVVTGIRHLQALSPWSPTSAFRDLEGGGEVLTARSLFNQVYGGANALVLQTCIAAYGNPSWGRLFVLAQPAPGPMGSALLDKLTRQIAEID